jgi:polysaccharide pyruvyl transferase WcaK-like protein
VSLITTPVVILNDTRVDRHHGCSRVMAAIESLASKNGLRILASNSAHSDWRQNTDFMGQLKNAKLVIVNGEGTIHHSLPAGLKLLEIGDFAKKMEIPAVLINTGWENNCEKFNEHLKSFCLVSARDSLSQSQIHKAGIACLRVPDLSLYLESPMIEGRRNNIGFTDSVCKSVSIEIANIQAKLREVSFPIQYSSEGFQGSWKFFREYLSKQDLLAPRILASTLDLRIKQFKNQTRDTRGYLDKMSRFELIVSGRFHACALAILMKTPFITAPTNSHKIRALVHDANLCSWRLNMPLNQNNILRAKEIGWEKGEEKSITEYVNYAREAADDLFSQIKKLV